MGCEHSGVFGGPCGDRERHAGGHGGGGAVQQGPGEPLHGEFRLRS